MSESVQCSCQQCTFQNKPGDHDKCKKCFPHQNPSEEQIQTWECLFCCSVNPVGVNQCAYCSFNLLSIRDDDHGAGGEKDAAVKIPMRYPDELGRQHNVDFTSSDRQSQGSASFQEGAVGGMVDSSTNWRTGERTEETDDEVLEFPDEECRVVLVGKTGNGKSHTCNTILGLNRFESQCSFVSKTTRCQRYNNVRFGIRLEVVDTPDLFDTGLSHDITKTEIAKCLGILAPGPHAILVVIRLDVRFTEEESKAVDKLVKIFGNQMFQYLVVVFSHGDVLKNSKGMSEKEAMQAKLDELPRDLKKLLVLVRDRYVVFDNMASEAVKEQQVKKLLQTIGRMLKVNGGRPYGIVALADVEKCMQKREDQLQMKLMSHQRRGDRHAGHHDVAQFRHMAREEVAAGNTPLLDEIMANCLPLNLIERLISIMVSNLFRMFVGYLETGGTCSLM